MAAVVGGIRGILAHSLGLSLWVRRRCLLQASSRRPCGTPFAFSLLIVVLLVWPRGIFGEPPAEKV